MRTASLQSIHQIIVTQQRRRYQLSNELSILVSHRFTACGSGAGLQEIFKNLLSYLPTTTANGRGRMLTAIAGA